MQSLSGLIVRLERAKSSDRRLDSEIVAALLGPPGCVLDPNEGLDGWDVQFAPDADGQAALWREAADISGVTAFLDAACEVAHLARPKDGGAVLARALRSIQDPAAAMTAAEMAGLAARTVLVELLRVVASERVEAAQAA